MLTIFAIPKAFRGHIGVIQRNAIRSWTLLHAGVEVILFGDDEGTAEAARELGVNHVPNVERNEFGTYLLNSVFAKAQKMARHQVLCYVNCDIVLMQDFARAAEKAAAEMKEFLMVGHRWDVEIREALRFEAARWSEELRERVRREGRKRGADWIDYFVFTRGLYGEEVPAFAIGRTFWDDWLVWKVLAGGKPVVDATPVVTAVHQNHDYDHHAQGTKGVWNGEEARRNQELAGGWEHLRTIADATLVLNAEGLRSNPRRPWASRKRSAARVGRFVKYKMWRPAWFLALEVTRPLRKALGLRAQTLRRP
jgi:hypothetical protein